MRIVAAGGDYLCGLYIKLLADFIGQCADYRSAGYYFGQKPREIAAALGLDKKQVDNRLYQTKRRLRASVTGAEGE